MLIFLLLHSQNEKTKIPSKFGCNLKKSELHSQKKQQHVSAKNEPIKESLKNKKIMSIKKTLEAEPYSTQEQKMPIKKPGDEIKDAVKERLKQEKEQESINLRELRELEKENDRRLREMQASEGEMRYHLEKMSGKE